MRTINEVVLSGFVGNTPQVRTFDSGDKIVTFSLATNNSYLSKKTNEWVNTTYWHNIVARGSMVDPIEEQIKQGHKVYLKGEITNREYTNPIGVEVLVTEISINYFSDETYNHIKAQQEKEKKSQTINTTKVTTEKE